MELLTQSREDQENIYREARLAPTLLDNIDSRIAYEDFHRFAAIAMTGRTILISG